MSDSHSIMVIAGEDSADQYAGRLIAALQSMHGGLSFFGMGGNRMKALGADLLFTTEETSIMGFAEIVTHYGLIRRMFADCERALDERKPSVVVLIDYPGFNLRFAKKAKERGIPVVYYITPQVWAWGKDRVRKMKSLVDEAAVVFPFEEPIFAREGISTTFVGHPLLEILQHTERHEFLKEFDIPDKRILALLPGSRKQELKRMLPPILEAADKLAHEYDFIAAIGAADLPDEHYLRHLEHYPNVRLLRGATHRLMEHAFAAIVTSGTATVETAFYETPMAVGYIASALNYAIGKRLVNIQHIAMVNILAGKRIVPELLQGDVSGHSLADAVRPYFSDSELYARKVEELRAIKAQMGAGGASQRVAEIVSKYLS